MTSRDFCYWLQGFIELRDPHGDAHSGFTADQTECLRKHLALVFKHEIDPSFGNEKAQTELNKIHGSPLLRC